MPDDINLKCRLCGKTVPVKEMRYHRSGQYLICRECADKQSGIVKKGTTQMDRGKTITTRPEFKEKPAKMVSQKGGSVSYKCDACNYGFSRSANFEVSSCPYCGSEKVYVSKGGSAQELIEEASEREDF